MHMAGHPDDQEVRSSSSGPGSVNDQVTPHSPIASTWLGRRASAGTERPALGAGSPRDDLGLLQRAQALSEDRARDPWQAALSLEALGATHLAHDQERPAVAEDLACLGDGQY